MCVWRGAAPRTDCQDLGADAAGGAAPGATTLSVQPPCQSAQFAFLTPTSYDSENKAVKQPAFLEGKRQDCGEAVTSFLPT